MSPRKSLIAVAVASLTFPAWGQDAADPGVVAGKRVLVYDDVFTSGTTMRQVALKLIAAGATGVDAVVLARQPFR